MADQYIARYKFIKVTEIVLSAVASSSFLFALLGDSHAGFVVGSIVSAVLLGLTLYFKEAALTEKAQAHTEVAAKLWAAREALLSLLVDMSDGGNVEHIRARRDELNASLEAIAHAHPHRILAKSLRRIDWDQLRIFQPNAGFIHNLRRACGPDAIIRACSLNINRIGDTGCLNIHILKYCCTSTTFNTHP